MQSGAAVQLYVALRLFVLPAGATAIGLLLARFAGARPAIAIGAAAGATAALVGFTGVPALPPVDSIGWIPVVTLASLALLALDRRVALGALAAAAAYLVGRPAWDGPLAAVWIAASAVATVAIVEGIAAGPAPWSWFTMLLVAAAAAVTALLSHSAMLAMCLGALATVAGTLAVGGLVLKVRPGGRALAAALVVPAVNLVLYARLFSAAPPLSVGLLAAAALVPLALRKRAVAALIVAAALAAGAAGYAQHVGAAAEDDEGAMYR